MRWALLASAILCCALLLQAMPQKPVARKIPCKTPENAASCYWTHGRLSFYNGTPAYRLWKIGTKRLLGIYSGPTAWRGDQSGANLDNEDPELPSNLRKAYGEIGDEAFADFEVCPLAPEREGQMQPACIESAKNIVVKNALTGN